MRYTIESETLKVTVESLGAELVSAVGADGYEYVWQGDPAYWEGHAPVLFPHCGRILNGVYTYGGKSYNMASHGFASKCEFTPTRVTKSELVLTLSDSSETMAVYPFAFSLEARFTVEGNLLQTVFTVKNKSEAVMPYMLGWHPAFNLDGAGGSAIGDYKLSFNADDKLTWFPLQNGCFVRLYGEDYPAPAGEYVLNEEEIYANDTMIFTGTGERAVLSSAKESHDVDFSWSENLPYFCIWKAPESGARFVCLEPWSDVPGDGETPECFETKRMSRLAAGECAEYTYSAKFC